jgi:DNA-binding CsgD family transcriptional regulator
MNINHDTIQIEWLKSYGFTDSEIAVLNLFLTGKSNKQIAKFLLISNRTVETHINRIYRQIGITHSATNKRLTAFLCLAADEIIKITRASIQHENN